MRIAVRITVLFLLLAAAMPVRAQGMPSPATFAAVGDVTRTPYGWADLCGRQPQECQVEVLDAVDLHLTAKTWAMLDRINARVNADIEPVSNMDHWGTMLDHWDYVFYVKGYC